ncbi:MAG: polyprenyl synthetase family protein, partial [Bacteroidales bacterium]|nr:polyprenyl synthetase family protein [Bacteroidales bacterium]
VDNKKTFLAIQALEAASTQQREELSGWLTRKEFDREEKIGAVTSIFDSLNVKELTKKRIRDYYQEALSNLEKLNRPEERKSELYNFASFLMNRNR